MSVRVITPPKPIVSLDEAKRHIIVDHNDDDVLLEGYISAASMHIDGPAGWVGRSIEKQTLELSYSGFQFCSGDCWGIDLPFPEVVASSVVIRYFDQAEELQTVSPADYHVFDNAIYLQPGFRPSATALRPDAVQVQYEAGYGTYNGAEPPVWTSTVPAPIKVAVLMIVAQWYRFRMPIALDQSVADLPFAAEVLLAPFRMYR